VLASYSAGFTTQNHCEGGKVANEWSNEAIKASCRLNNSVKDRPVEGTIFVEVAGKPLFNDGYYYLLRGVNLPTFTR
jgi:hypothetical protein